MPKTIHTRKNQALRQTLVASRIGAGVTQIDLARRLRRSQSYVSKVEIGDRRLDAVEFVAWAQALSVDPHVVLQAIIDA